MKPLSLLALLGANAALVGLLGCSTALPEDGARLQYRDGVQISARADGARSVVRLSFEESGHEVPYCSGVLVSPRVVLTAAHCIVRVHETDQSIGSRIAPDAIKIRLSDGTLTQGKSADFPAGLGFAYQHVDALDVAYIELEKEASSTLVAEVATRDEFRTWSSQPGRKGKGIGYGKTTSSARPGSLNALDLPFVGFFGPRKDFGTLEMKPATTPDSQAQPLEFMFGFDTLNACPGDSGGGLFVTIDGKQKLAGIASRTLSAPSYEMEACALGTLATVYGSADAARAWAKAKAPTLFDRPAP